MDQLLEVGLALRCGDADAGTDAHDPGVEMRGGGDRLDDPLGDVRGCPAAGVAEQDGELVPPDACAQVPRAGGPAQAYCDLAEQLVTRSVTEGVVDVLEVVEVDEQDSRVLRGPVVEGARQCGVERRPVNPTRESVERRPHRQLPAHLAVAQRECYLVRQAGDRDDRLSGHAPRRAEEQPRAPVLVCLLYTSPSPRD